MKKKTVLLVDDDVIYLNVMKERFENMGCVVLTALNGNIALDMIEDFVFGDKCLCACVIDLHMDTMNGEDAVRLLRLCESEAPLFKRTFMVCVTADSNANERSVDSGMDAFFVKPLTDDDMCSILTLGDV